MNRTDNIDKINNLNAGYKQFHFDFVSKRLIFLAVAGVIFLTGIISFFTRGFNWDIDFVGGTIMEYNMGRDLSVSDVEDIESLAVEILGANAVSSVVRSGNPAQQVVIKTQDIDTDKRNEIFEALAEKYNITEDDIYRTNNVNPTVGETLTRSTILSVVIASVLMLIYISVRFDFKSGLATVICLLFDLFVMLTVYSLLQISMNVAVIAAFLTILGYSINATIIIFDRVRENMKLKRGANIKFAEIINMSLSQTIARSFNTTLTTFFVLIVLFIIGVPSIRTFVLPLIVGIMSGLFSSLCLAGQLWNFLKGAGEEKSKNKAK
ncbi:MAG: protein translocase subunit SecF [Oscillospiraceae bacterium]|nr:protein translocase subunit SecF [Oscillospiraceae bacterium]